MSPIKSTVPAKCTRLKLAVHGAVQGVGFRPFVHRLATELTLVGRVSNSPQGVSIEVEGRREVLQQFFLRLEAEKPPRSFIQSLEASWLDAVGYNDFQIGESKTDGAKSALVLPDAATCSDCLSEIFDPSNRRYGYPFTNCTHCGPRFSIIEALPYDRANTSMRNFPLCPACTAEYHDPRNRRFHAQPNACPVCGPQLELWESCADVPPAKPLPLACGSLALLVALAAVRRGQIVAVKGIGGFHLMVDARNARAVRRLRDRKHREEKPFALMFPTLESVKAVCKVSPLEERLLCSPEAPIVLLKKRSNGVLEYRSADVRPTPCSTTPSLHDSIAPSAAPGNPNLGVMLPSNPLHHLLMAGLGYPVVATSGNLSDEPICTDEHDALDRLRGIADVFLVHNRPIVRHVDDSIVRVMLDRVMVLRRARGYAPLPIQIKNSKLEIQNVLAVGAHLKNSVALAVGEQVFISQHIGDLETEQANNAFRRVAADLPLLYEATPEVIVADLHPDYLSTRFALERGCPQPQHFAMQVTVEKFSRTTHSEAAAAGDSLAPRLIRVQHHIAHALSCIAENEVDLPALGVAWDGTGLGTDGTIWGGEFFRVTAEAVERVAQWRPFRLPGGDAAAKEPRRAALGLLHELWGAEVFSRTELPTVAAFSYGELAALKTMVTHGVNAPWCCSVGRLFDVVASLVGLRHQMRFEGQAAMELEFALDGVETAERYTLSLSTGQTPLVIDWSLMIQEILRDLSGWQTVGNISAKFHNTLAEAIVTVAKRIGEHRVAMSGGCFQNRYLTERTVMRLREEGFLAYWHQRVPANDGGIALGQVVAARRELSRVEADVSPLYSSRQEIRADSRRLLQTTS